MVKNFAEQMTNKVEGLRNDLALEITKLDIQQGNIIVVQPKNPNFVLPDQYRAWIIEVFASLKPGIPVMVLGDNQLEFRVEQNQKANVE